MHTRFTMKQSETCLCLVSLWLCAKIHSEECVSVVLLFTRYFLFSRSSNFGDGLWSFKSPAGVSKCFKVEGRHGKVGSCDNQDCLSRADCDVQTSRRHTVKSRSRRNSSSRQLVLFLCHGLVPRKVVKFNPGLSQPLSKVFLSMAVIKSRGTGFHRAT